MNIGRLTNRRIETFTEGDVVEVNDIRYYVVSGEVTLMADGTLDLSNGEVKEVV